MEFLGSSVSQPAITYLVILFVKPLLWIVIFFFSEKNVKTEGKEMSKRNEDREKCHPRMIALNATDTWKLKLIFGYNYFSELSMSSLRALL
jgi:hypothetical protein